MPKYLFTLFYVFPSFDACLLFIPLVSLLLRRYLKPHTCSQNQCNCCELICPSLSTHREQLPPGTCRTASQQPGRLSSSLAIDSRQSLDFLALTETWIHTRQHSQPFASPTHPGLLAEGCECVCVGGGLYLPKVEIISLPTASLGKSCQSQYATGHLFPSCSDSTMDRTHGVAWNKSVS